jgi:hypothetical protein
MESQHGEPGSGSGVPWVMNVEQAVMNPATVVQSTSAATATAHYSSSNNSTPVIIFWTSML